MVSPLSGINAVASNFIQCKQSQTGVSKFIVRSTLGTSFDSRENQVNPSNYEKLLVSRRVCFGIGVIALFPQLQTGPARAEDNGWWITGPLPIPTVTSKITNEETGTRSFLQNGIYMAKILPEGSAYRLRQCAFDLLAMKDLIYQGDVWPHIRRYLCLKSTFMYYDFDIVISAANDEEKPPLTNLANRLFDNAELLLEAVVKKDEPLTKSIYADTEVILQEVMAKMA
ncbi:psbQ-like protein 2 [Carex littledalei]|uniref:PsbQ-like protein 2 n=1 Tax=Carex littledalei TaxID=544730 RepID=A0A833QLI3_9POAL|nr:psbQ-like protein 2 [Carex littledalei]